MEGSKLSFVELASDGVASLTYFTEVPFRDVRPLARREMGNAPKINNSEAVLFDFGPRNSVSLGDVDLYMEVTPQLVDMSNYPPVPVAHGTIIHLIREPTALDRFRAWQYGLRWKGSK